MNPFLRLLVLVLASILLLTGFFVSFSYTNGTLEPTEFLNNIQLPIDTYLFFGIIILILVLCVGAFIFFKEKFLGYS